MSTRSSIWLGEENGKHVHIYWELAARDIKAGEKIGKIVAPICLAVDGGNADEEVVLSLPKSIAEQILRVLLPNWQESYEVLDVGIKLKAESLVRTS